VAILAKEDTMRDDSKHAPGTAAGTLTEEETHEHHDANRDPITGEPGAHPVGTGVGAVAGAAAGAAVGAAGGPVGAVVGGAVGAVVGGLAGHGVAEQINPTAEDTYWRETYKSRPYVERERPYEDYQPAYRYGWESRARHPERSWDEALERDLERGWEKERGRSGLSWQQAKPATQEAWQRVSPPGVSGPVGMASPSASGAAALGDLGALPAFEVESLYWSEAWQTQPYADASLSYEDYEPAYRYGWDARHYYGDRTWDAGLERDLESGWEKAKGRSRLTWERAKQAARDAWDRFAKALPGKADREGR
jgi:hypothetical protein